MQYPPPGPMQPPPGGRPGFAPSPLGNGGYPPQPPGLMPPPPGGPGGPPQQPQQQQGGFAPPPGAYPPGQGPFPGQPPPGAFPGQGGPPGGFPGQGPPGAVFPGQGPPGAFPGQGPPGVFPGQGPPGAFPPGPRPQAPFANRPPMGPPPPPGGAYSAIPQNMMGFAPSGPPSHSGVPLALPPLAPPSTNSSSLAGIPLQGPSMPGAPGMRPMNAGIAGMPPLGPPPPNGYGARPPMGGGFPPAAMGGPPSAKGMGMGPPGGGPPFPPGGFSSGPPPPGAGFPPGGPRPPGGSPLGRYPGGAMPPPGGFPGGMPPGGYPGGMPPPGSQGFPGGPGAFPPGHPSNFPGGGVPAPTSARGVNSNGSGGGGGDSPRASGAPGQAKANTRIDSSQIPRPASASRHGAQDAPLVFQTRVGNAHCIPPPAASRFVVRDCGSCGPRYMRATLNQVPHTSDLLNNSAMPLAVVVSPLALPDPGDEPIQVVDLGELGPVRCGRCKAYMNAFMRFNNGGRSFTCNFCSHSNVTPDAYFCHMGADGRRGDADERPELCKGSIEYVAPATFSVRPAMPPSHFFLLDASHAAVAGGVTAALCAALAQVLQGVEDPRVLVGVATFDGASVQFYSLRSPTSPPQMLVVSDVQEVFAPGSAALLVPLVEHKDQLVALLDSLPAMFAQPGASGRPGESCAGAALAAAVDVLAPTGGKLHAFVSAAPTAGLHAFKTRDTPSPADKDKLSYLSSQDQGLKALAITAAEFQVCMDISLVSTSHVDVATWSELCSSTGGTVYSYAPFNPQLDFDQLVNDLRWNMTRIQGMEGVLRVRCSAGLEVEQYLGAFHKRPNNTTDLDLPGIDCDKAILARVVHVDKLALSSEAAVQCALLYTTTAGERRIRVHTLSLPVTDNISMMFKGADLDAQITTLGRRLAATLPSSTLGAGRELITAATVTVLHAYRRYCAASSSNVQLILPEALKLLPLYALSLLKSPGLKDGVRPDERALWVAHVMALPAARIAPLLYPRIIPVHKLVAQEEPPMETALDGLLASSESLEQGGVYLLENGMDALLYLDKDVDPTLVSELLGVASMDELARVATGAVGLQPRPTRASQILQDLLVRVRTQRCSFLRLRVARRGDPAELAFFSGLVEDRSVAGMSYVEYLCAVHRLIQNRM